VLNPATAIGPGAEKRSVKNSRLAMVPVLRSAGPARFSFSQPDRTVRRPLAKPAPAAVLDRAGAPNRWGLLVCEVGVDRMSCKDGSAKQTEAYCDRFNHLDGPLLSVRLADLGFRPISRGRKMVSPDAPPRGGEINPAIGYPMTRSNQPLPPWSDPLSVASRRRRPGRRGFGPALFLDKLVNMLLRRLT
jgi:hypothetical protein